MSGCLSLPARPIPGSQIENSTEFGLLCLSTAETVKPGEIVDHLVVADQHVHHSVGGVCAGQICRAQRVEADGGGRGPVGAAGGLCVRVEGVVEGPEERFFCGCELCLLVQIRQQSGEEPYAVEHLCFVERAGLGLSRERDESRGGEPDQEKEIPRVGVSQKHNVGGREGSKDVVDAARQRPEGGPDGVRNGYVAERVCETEQALCQGRFCIFGVHGRNWRANNCGRKIVENTENALNRYYR
ncbi:hypothetical protein KL942_000722 [Ogataea angusta]|uniref:Uncharacterized protein n=1 Tax=Pichia angusta TaxID=870730 RepID=A0ABQ7S2L3_PICAN|nr:hypothetical protein KL942_000722 [Ogataea angusta]KAG7852221.1 hypothetical protein KL940_001103 [Ogataea angusta]